MSWASDKNWVIEVNEATHKVKGTLRNKGLNERTWGIQVEVHFEKWLYLRVKKKIANKGNKRQVKEVEGIIQESAVTGSVQGQGVKNVKTTVMRRRDCAGVMLYGLRTSVFRTWLNLLCCSKTEYKSCRSKCNIFWAIKSSQLSNTSTLKT